MKFIQWLKYRDIKDYTISERTVLVSNEKHWFAPLSEDDKLWCVDSEEERYTLSGIPIVEGIAKDQQGLDKHNGGIVVFSTDVNAVDISKSQIVSWFRKRFNTFINRLSKDRKLTNIIATKFQESVKSFTIGNFFKGRYVERGKVFDEKSISIEVLGISSEILIRLATEIARDFNQSTVLLKDYNTNKNILIDKE